MYLFSIPLMWCLLLVLYWFCSFTCFWSCITFFPLCLSFFFKIYYSKDFLISVYFFLVKGIYRGEKITEGAACFSLWSCTIDEPDCLYISPMHHTSHHLLLLLQRMYTVVFLFIARFQNRVPWPGFEPGLLRPQRRVLTTIRSRLANTAMLQHNQSKPSPWHWQAAASSYNSHWCSFQ